MRAAALALFLGLAALPAIAAPVEVVNATKPTRCAEEDNVYVKFLGQDVSFFEIRAVLPPYIQAVTTESKDPDFTHCDMSQDPSFPFEPRTVTLYEDARIRLVGHTFKTNWRPDVVDFRVEDRNERGLHLVQLFLKHWTGGMGGEIEFLVLYPGDGYWRLKPMPPPHLQDSAYGSSFLIGPIEESSRPFVALKSIAFDPSAMAFRLDFARGGAALLRVADIRPDYVSLKVQLGPPVGPGPFAALRSMFVTTDQADMTEVAWQDGFAKRVLPILGFPGARTEEVRFGRSLQSHHNLTAPDLIFRDFSGK